MINRPSYLDPTYISEFANTANQNLDISPEEWIRQNIAPTFDNFDPVTEARKAVEQGEQRYAELHPETISSQPNIDAPEGQSQPEGIDLSALLKYREQNKPKSFWEKGNNIIVNGLIDLKEMGTGLVSLMNPDTWKTLQGMAGDYFTPDLSVGQFTKDIANLLLENYNIDLNTLGDRTARDIVGGIIQGIYENPADTAMDVMSFGGAGLVRNLARKVPVLSRIVKAGEVEKAVAGEAASGVQKSVKYNETIKKAEEAAIKNNVKFEDVLKAAEEGTKLPEGGLESYKILKQASKDYDDLVKAASPDTYKGMESTAINQKILRERLKTNPEATFNDVERQTTPLLEMIDDGRYDEVLRRAKQGNVVAKEVIGAKTLYDKGRIIPITHVGAEIERGVTTLDDLAKQAIKYNGRFSERAIGNTSYDALAKAVVNNNEYVDKLAEQYLNRNIAGQILRGEFLGTGEQAGKNIAYLSKEALMNGDLRKAINNPITNPNESYDRIMTQAHNIAQKKGKNLDDIIQAVNEGRKPVRGEKGLYSLVQRANLSIPVAIDKDYLAVLRDQTGKGSQAYSGALQDLWSVNKSAMLGGGTYVAGNILTGAYNTVVNSGAHVLDDFVNAIKSKGELAKNAGIYRYAGEREVKTPILKQIYQVNRALGGKVFGAIDRNVQNLWAEMALHKELRSAGKGAETLQGKLDTITQMDKMKLGEMIVNARRAALINSPKTILPKELEGLANTVSPFWRWMDTATQSTVHMIEHHPLIANVLMADIAANIGFDVELQNRLNLGVQSKKPFVTYRFDQRSGKIKEIRADFIPQMTTLKMADAETYRRMGGSPILAATMQALEGKNSYGNYSKRPVLRNVMAGTVGSKRYMTGADGTLHEVGGQGDEILSAVIKDTFGAPRLYNRTISPLIASAWGGKSYQPYDMSIFASFNPNPMEGNVLFSGQPNRGRTIGDVGKSMLTLSESEYNPRYDRPQPNLQGRIIRQNNRYLNRMQYGGYNR